MGVEDQIQEEKLLIYGKNILVIHLKMIEDKGLKFIKEFEGPLILKDEIEWPLGRMIFDMATEPENISEAVEDIGMNKKVSILNKMYDTVTIPKTLSSSIFLKLLKRQAQFSSSVHSLI